MHNLPNFPLVCNVWRWNGGLGAFQEVLPLHHTPCQLHNSIRPPYFPLPPAQVLGGQIVHIYLAKGTDVRDPACGLANPDVIECPAQSGRFYAVLGVDDFAKGFSNEFRVCVCLKSVYGQFGNWPSPIP